MGGNSTILYRLPSYGVIELAANPSRVQIMFGFDNDDDIGTKHFEQELQPWLDDQGINYTAMSFSPLGYIRLNEYVNELALNSDASWLVFWNDDAVMETQDWDKEIIKHEGEFKLLAFHTHHDHPYSIFPIVPRKWLDLLGYLSPHQISDAWLSQQAYMLDIWERIEVDVLHDRHDLTGNNNDETFQNRPMLEGNPKDSNVKGNHEQVFDPVFARRVCEAYFKKYEKKAFDNGDFETLARCHNGGCGWRKNKSATNGYWQKIKKNL